MRQRNYVPYTRLLDENTVEYSPPAAIPVSTPLGVGALIPNGQSELLVHRLGFCRRRLEH